MNDTPGWASPGPAPSDGREPGASGPAVPPGAERPAGAPAPEQGHAGPQWSDRQPPPGQWSAPAGPGQAPHPGGQAPPAGGGWGGQGGYGAPGGWGGPGGGWGGGWGGPPPAAKPGVIPLRPLGLGEILDGSVSTMRAHWRTVLGISLTVAVLTEVVTVLFQGFLLDKTGPAALDRDPSPGEVADVFFGALLGSTLVFAVTLVGTVVATALLTTVTSRAVLGASVTTREAWRDARPQVPRLLGMVLLMMLMVSGVLLAGLLPGLLVTFLGGDNGAGTALTVLGFLGAAVYAVRLMVRLSLASPALMLEKQGIVKALRRSGRLVDGSWWRMFGIQLLTALIVGAVGVLVVVPFAFVAGLVAGDGFGDFVEGAGGLGWAFLIISGIGSVIGSMITLPISAGVTVLLYIDQRIRREALDLELARAAGVQAPGAGAPGTVPGS
ncbi:membrane protein [Streptomyces sp. NRRL F-5065]|uniref:membrane protein n=1 Tax=Streptomyces sp. NRRL F-5065 TaxID=1463855 RepID=UPI0004C07E41|nr:membrane protein [Streptomyces sp. NRRL F-5065]